MAELAPVIKDKECERRFPGFVSTSRRAFKKTLWLNNAGLFADRADDNGPVREELSEVANAYALWTGVLSQKEANFLIAVLRDTHRLMIRIQSPYTLHHYVYGLANYGALSLAVDLIRWAYLHHLDHGGNTLGERFQRIPSLIHGVTGFIAVWLLECALGLSPTLRGARRVTWAFRPTAGFTLPAGCCTVYPGGQQIKHRWPVS
jgi:hypothetical protein